MTDFEKDLALQRDTHSGPQLAGTSWATRVRDPFPGKKPEEWALTRSANPPSGHIHPSQIGNESLSAYGILRTAENPHGLSAEGLARLEEDSRVSTLR